MTGAMGSMLFLEDMRFKTTFTREDRYRRDRSKQNTRRSLFCLSFYIIGIYGEKNLDNELDE